MNKNDSQVLRAPVQLQIQLPEGLVTVSAVSGQTVAQAVWLSGKVPPAALCSGLGRCGACRVRFVSEPPPPQEVERRVLGQEALAQGHRLACRHMAEAGMIVEPLSGAGNGAAADLPHAAGRPQDGTTLPGHAVALAVDLGTTSIWWQATSPEGGCSGRELNPQLGAGSDVMSRVAMARTPEGRTRLRELVLDRLRGLVRRTGASRLCVAGNTAMTAILLDKDCAGLAAAPYVLPESGNRDVRLPGLPPVWIPPQPAPFVGGDVSAGLAAVQDAGPDFPFLLADMGTNGEFALMTDAQTLWLASVPLGPSLEGIGLSCGAMAGPGVVTDFTLGPGGLVPHLLPTLTPGQTQEGAHGISGTGYLALLHLLRTQGVLDEAGVPCVAPGVAPRVAPCAPPVSPLGRRLAAAVSRPDTGPWHLTLPHTLTLTAMDVEELVKVRAAFSLAVARLLQAAGVRPEALGGVYLAGALGEHVSARALEGLGFLPVGLGARLRAAGNTSLAGAALLLARPDTREPLARLCASARILELTAAPDFMAAYVDRLRLTAFQF